MNQIVYLLYGTDPVYRQELSYSILSVLNRIGHDQRRIRIVVFTDPDNQQPSLPVDYVPISAEDQKRWTFDGRWDHAAKVFCLGQALEQFGGKVILADTDTIFCADPAGLFDSIGPGRALMHENEGPLARSDQQAEWAGLLTRVGGAVNGYRMSMQSDLCNSGIVGLDHADRALTNDIVGILQTLIERDPVFTIEQFSTSTVLNAKTRVGFAGNRVTHYWNGPRRYYRYQMARMFPKDPAALADRMAGPLPPLRDVPPTRLSDVVATRIRQMWRGADAAYGHAWLAARSAVARSEDAGLADVWAGISVDMLRYAVQAPQHHIVQDFATFLPDRLDDHAWMTPRTRAQWRAYWADAARAHPGVSSPGA